MTYFCSGIKTDNLVWLITRISKFQWIILSSLTMWKHIRQCKMRSLHIRKCLTITTWSFRRNTVSNEIKRNSSCSLYVILNYLHQEIRWMRHTGRRFNCFAHTTRWRVTRGSQYTELPPPSNTPADKALSDFFSLEWKIWKCSSDRRMIKHIQTLLLCKFDVYGTVHRWSILPRITNKMQRCKIFFIAVSAVSGNSKQA
jgi:hypothetical protein